MVEIGEALGLTEYAHEMLSVEDISIVETVLPCKVFASGMMHRDGSELLRLGTSLEKYEREDLVHKDFLEVELYD